MLNNMKLCVRRRKGRTYYLFCRMKFAFFDETLIICKYVPMDLLNFVE